jgi:hypothetical protein
MEPDVKKWSPFGVGGHRERIIIFVSALVGIVAFIVLIRRKNAANAEAVDNSTFGLGSDQGAAMDLAGSPNNLGGYGGYDTGYIPASSGSSVDVGTVPVSAAPVPSGVNFNLSYQEDTGVTLQGTKGSGSSGGGFGINAGWLGKTLGLTVGGKTSTNTQSFDIAAPQTFQATTSIENATPESIAGLQTFLEEVGGTAEQRMVNQKQVLASGSEAVSNITGTKPVVKVSSPQTGVDVSNKIANVVS